MAGNFYCNCRIATGDELYGNVIGKSLTKVQTGLLEIKRNALEFNKEESVSC